MNIKDFFSRRQKNWLKLKLAPLRLRKEYKHDYLKFLNNSYYLKKSKDLFNLRALLTFHSHSLEKGFIHDNFRPGFGRDAIDGLLLTLNEYQKKGYSEQDLRFKIAVSNLKRYSDLHRKLGFLNENTKKVNNWLSKNDNLNINKTEGGFFVLSLEEVKLNQKEDFNHFSKMRHSVRDFNGEKIDRQTISEAVELAANAPSVCNRQATKVYNVENEELIQKVLRIQHGIIGMGHGLSNLLVVTSDNRYFGGINEHNQPYIDGGIFGMNLLYSLQYYMIAACPLNANLSLKGEKMIKQYLDIDSSECIIMFVIIGGFKKDNKIPTSKRESYRELLVNVKEGGEK